MKFIVKEGNVQRTYLAYFDIEEMKRLLDNIIDYAGYSRYGVYELQENEVEKDENGNLRPTALLPNGKPVFKVFFHMSKIRNRDGDTYFGEYYHRNAKLSSQYLLDGLKVYIPSLAGIVRDLIDGKEDALSRLLDYKNHDDFKTILERVLQLEKEANQIPDYNYNKKIDALIRLRDLVDEKNNHNYFDNINLHHLYDDVLDAIHTTLIKEEALREDKKVHLKDLVRK